MSAKYRVIVDTFTYTETRVIDADENIISTRRNYDDSWYDSTTPEDISPSEYDDYDLDPEDDDNEEDA